jgi:TolA-binding protein
MELVRDVRIVVLLCSLFYLFLIPADTSSASVSLSSYEATFEVIANPKSEFRDVQVELKITYHIQGKLKKEGKKFVEVQPVEAVQVTDGEGKPLKFRVSESGKRYSKISWYFPGITEGEQVVVIRFKIPNAITIADERNYFRAYWVGSWVVPVKKALYRFIFPDGYSYQDCSIYPQYKYEEKLIDKRRQVEVSIIPLKGESFALAFSPDFAEWEKAKEADKLSDRTASNDEVENGKESSREVEGKSENESEKTVADEKKLSQLKPSVFEGKVKEEDVKEEKEEEEEKEKKKEERVAKDEKVRKKDTTIKIDRGKEGDKQVVEPEAKRVYVSARELFQQKKYKEALSNLRYFMDNYPRSILADEVSFLIGDCYFCLADEGSLSSYHPAVSAFQLAIALYPDSKDVPRGLFQMANSYREMKYHYEADENYKLLIDEHPHAECIPDAHFWMAENLFQNDEFEEAKNLFQNLIIEYPKINNIKQAVFRIADCYAGLKKYEKARKYYEKALNRWANYSRLFPETLFYLGLTYLKSGDYARGRSLLFLGFNVFPKEDYNHIILTKIGDAYQMEGKVEEALKVYSQNGVMYPESKGALISEIKMADIGVNNPGFFSFDQYLDPLKVYHQIIKKYPITELAEEALYKQGFAFSEQKRYQDGIVSLKVILEDYPDSDLSRKAFYSVQEMLCRLIDSYYSEGKYYFILDTYRKNEDPFLDDIKNTRTLFQVGESFRQVGFYDEALEIYKEARRIYPRNYPEDALILRMGEIYLLEKKYAKANKLFKKLIKSFPESGYRKLAFHNLADSYFQQGSYEKARLAYLTALEGEQRIPRDIKGFFYLGKCYQAMGDISLTIEAYRKAVQVAEDLGKDQMEDEYLIKSYFQLADYLYQTQRYLDAIEVYTQAAERYPEDERAQWALYRIAAGYRKAGKGSVEIESLKKLVSEGKREPFWEKVISENIRNLEWEEKNREHLAH